MLYEVGCREGFIISSKCLSGGWSIYVEESNYAAKSGLVDLSRIVGRVIYLSRLRGVLGLHL